MSRPRANQDTVRKAFVHEVKMRRTDLEMTQDELGDSIGVSSSQISKLLANPDKISAGRLRAIVQTVAPDPAIVLAFLGYPTKITQRLKGDTNDR